MPAKTIPKARILCTENDADTRELLTLVLSREGYEVICSDSAANAIALLKSEKFDLVLMDNWMPDISGPRLTEKLREFNVKTPILFYSGAAYQKDKEAARLAGAQGYVVKPAETADLVAEIVKLIAEARIAYPVEIVIP